jgi:hypothetical protein
MAMLNAFNTTTISINPTQQRAIQNTINDSNCFPLNSRAWLNGNRMGNVPIPDDWLDHMMMMTTTQPHLPSTATTTHALQNPDVLFDQTLCYKTGRFRNTSPTWNATDADQIQDWQFRLLYLVIHRFHHMPALAEYQHRRQQLQNDQCRSSLSNLNISNFDYECPQTKFLVTALKTMGMGVTFRHGAISAMYMAFVMGRIPLFIQSIPNTNAEAAILPSALQAPFHLASCPRRDLQCVFLPTSPCVVTWDDLKHAPVLTKKESRAMKRSGVYHTKEHADVRVLIHESNLSPVETNFRIHGLFHKVAYHAMMDLLNVWKITLSAGGQEMLPEQWNVLTTAAEAYRSFEQTEWRIRRNLRAVQFYLMRPNFMARQEIARQLETTMMMGQQQQPQAQHRSPNNIGNDDEKRQYFGLPIRGSDKCHAESTCLSFDRYMELMLHKRQQHGVAGKSGTILLTSEDTSILPMRHAFASNISFPFDFIVNEHDVQPGTGAARTFQERADAIMISSLTAIKIQLQANVLVGNCCSNFHSLLFAFVRNGCGADPKVQFECLDKTQDPRFRICCAWTRTNECNGVRASYFKNRTRRRSKGRVNLNANVD